MKEIIVHIGTHKTGSTSIQAFCRRNEQILRNNGILIPRSGAIGAGGHHNIAWEVRGDVRFDSKNGTIKELLKELSNANVKKAILSSEDFEYLHQYPKELKYFNNALSSVSLTVRYFVVLRNKDEYAKSLFIELKKHGLRLKYKDYISYIIKDECFVFNEDWYFDFNHNRLLNLWSQITNAKIDYIKYEKSIQEGGVVPIFLRNVGAPTELIFSSLRAPRLNERPKFFQKCINTFKKTNKRLFKKNLQI